MIVALLFLFKLFLVFMGAAGCALFCYLVCQGFRTDRGQLLVTIPGMLVLLLIVIDSNCRIFHLPRTIIPHQVQAVHAITTVVQIAAMPLIGLRLYELWRKRYPKPQQHP